MWLVLALAAGTAVLTPLTIQSAQTHTADGRSRARGLGISLPGEPGPLNAITDVAGPEVDAFCTGVVQAVDKAVLDALVVNTDMFGRDGSRSPRLPVDRLTALLTATLE